MKLWFAHTYLFSLAAVVSLAVCARAASPESTQPTSSVGLFEAIAAGDIEAKFIPQNAAKGTVVITNKSSKAMTINMPTAFAGIPVLAQFGPPNNGPQNASSQNNGGTQRVAGTTSNANRNNNPNPFNGPGVFSIAPEQVKKLRITSVCLDHGKRSPHSRMPYRIAPLTEVTSDPRIELVMNRLQSGDIDQSIAQAAAWHVANKKSWEALAAEKLHQLGGSSEPLFSSSQIEQARRMIASLQTGDPLALDD